MRRRRKSALTNAGVAAIAHNLGAWRWLSPDERDRLLALTDELLRRKDWEAARGFELDDAMKAVLAAQASMPILELGLEHYRRVHSVIVHPTTLRLPFPQPGPSLGTVTSQPVAVHGLAQSGRGPVVLAWDQAIAGIQRRLPGHNVVLHEFAHKLDMQTGTVDGAPPLPRTMRDEWAQVCTDVFRDLAAGVPRPPMRWYGATNAAEFFAVATEVFFEQPHELAALEPWLYEVLSRYYQQQPVAREPAPWSAIAPA